MTLAAHRRIQLRDGVVCLRCGSQMPPHRTVEDSDFGCVTKTFTDPPIATQADLGSRVRTALEQSLSEDQTAGTLSIIPWNIAPGYDYNVPAWGQVASPERVEFAFGRDSPQGVLEFEPPSGVKHGLVDLLRSTETNRDAF